MKNQRMVPDLIKAFVENTKKLLILKDESALLEITFIQLIYRITIPRNQIFIDDYIETFNRELEKITRWKGIKSKSELDEMYVAWMEKLDKRSNEPYFSFMLSLYEKKLNELPEEIEKSKESFDNPLFDDFKELEEIEQAKSAFSKLTQGMDTIEGVDAIDLEPLIKFTGLNAEALRDKDFNQQFQLLGLAWLQHYFDHLLFLDLKDEFFRKSEEALDFEKIDWKGTQKQLGELFLELSRKGYISEITPDTIKTIQTVFNKSNTIGQVLKPTEAKKGERTYDGIYSTRYKSKFKGILSK